jgi:uncharacterized protein YggE
MNRRVVSKIVLGITLMLALGLISPGFSKAQQATPEGTDAMSQDGRSITVNGRGTVTIAPDSASIVVGVDVTGETLVAAQQDSAERMTTVLETLTEAGIPEDQIQTVDYRINVINEYDDNGRLKGVSGYQVSNQVQVTTDDIEGLGTLIDELVASGANTIYSINFFTSDATMAMSQARALAVADAKAKATELATAADVSLGQILTIAETSVVGGPVAKVATESFDMAGASTPIQSGSLQIVIDVTISFAIAS